MVGSIYTITNTINNKVYVGFTNREPSQRKWEHFSPCQIKRKTKLYNSIRKYSVENFIFEVIYCSSDEEHCLSTMEPYFIGLYNSYNTGLNSTFGGDKQVFTPETKAKISKTKMGHSVSKETREKLRQSAFKQFSSLEAKERLAGLRRKTWKIIYTSGEEEIVTKLKSFCERHEINYGSLTTNKQYIKKNISKIIEVNQ